MNLPAAKSGVFIFDPVVPYPVCIQNMVKQADGFFRGFILVLIEQVKQPLIGIMAVLE